MPMRYNDYAVRWSSLTIISLSRLVKLGGHIFTAPAEGRRHPGEFVEKALGPLIVSFVEQIAVGVEFLVDLWEIKIGERHGEAEFAYHRHASLDHTCSAPRPGRHANKRNGFVNIFS